MSENDLKKELNHILRELELLENELLIKEDGIDKKEKEKLILKIKILENKLDKISSQK